MVISLDSRMAATRRGDLAGFAGSGFELVARSSRVRGQRGRVLRGEAVLLALNACTAGASGSSGRAAQDVTSARLCADDERWEVGLGEVAVVVGLFLGAHGEGAAFGLVPEAGLLDDAAALFENARSGARFHTRRRSGCSGKLLTFLTSALVPNFGVALPP